MSLVNKIPSGSWPRIASLYVTTVFNAVSPGLYDFSNVDGLLDVPIKNGRLYLIDKMNFTANFEQRDYIESLQRAAKITFKFDRGKQPVYSRPILLPNYFNNAALTHFFYHDQRDTNLACTVDGSFLQTANMVGQNEFNFRFQFFIYEISDRDYIEEFRNSKPSSYYRGIA